MEEEPHIEIDAPEDTPAGTVEALGDMASEGLKTLIEYATNGLLSYTVKKEADIVASFWELKPRTPEKIFAALLVLTAARSSSRHASREKKDWSISEPAERMLLAMKSDIAEEIDHVRAYARNAEVNETPVEDLTCYLKLCDLLPADGATFEPSKIIGNVLEAAKETRRRSAEIRLQVT
jgi:hypothetical protein